MDVQSLLQQVALEDVRLIERMMELRLDEEQGVTGWSPADEKDIEIAFQVNQVSWGRTIESWFRIAAEHSDTRLSTAYAVIYSRDSEEEIPSAVRKEFLERVASMAAVPYLRTTFQSLASEARLGNFVIPMIRQGDIHLDIKDFEDNS